MQSQFQLGRLLAPDIAQMIAEGQLDEVREALLRQLDPDLADVLALLDADDRTAAFRLLPPERAAEVLSLLPDPQQWDLVDQLGRGQLAGVLSEMDPDDRTRLFEGLSETVVARLMALLAPQARQEAQRLLRYPPESVGRLITPHYLTVRPQWTARRVLEHVRRRGAEAESFDTFYVVDDRGRLVDDVPLRSILLADPDQTVESMIDGQFVSLLVTEDREQAVRAMERYDSPVLPVIDEAGVLVGIVTFDDVADVAEQEATEDFHRAAAVAPLPAGYAQTLVWELYRRRVGWLLALVGVNLVSSGVIAAYEETLSAFLALAFFMPLLIDSGGNTGSQGATLMIRALATQDVHLGEWLRILLKELGVGLTLGVTMAVASAALGVFRADWAVGLVVGLSMFCIVVVTNLIGVLLPFALTRLRVDPAVASSPLITTVADAAGLLIYFNLATVILTLPTNPAPPVYELRTDTAHPGRIAALHQRFEDHTLRLFERHGITNVMYWTPADAEDTLVYLLAHESEEAARRSYAAFHDDPEWCAVQEESERDGPLVADVDSRFLRPTGYSPPRRD